MVTLAITVIALLARPDTGYVRVTNIAIWAIFVVDYGLRLAFSSDRKAFVRANLVDLIAIMPADFFRAARALRGWDDLTHDEQRQAVVLLSELARPHKNDVPEHVGP